jgi:putative transposase
MYDYRHLTEEEKRQIVAEHLARGYPPHSPPHLRIDQANYILTATCYEHAAYMVHEERRHELFDLLSAEMVEAGIEISA